MRSLLILFLVIVLLAVGADRLALRFAESRVADGLHTTLRTAGTPSVSLAGFPFLTQVISGHYQGLTVSANGVRGAADTPRSVRIETLTARATDLRTANGFSEVIAGNVTGTAQMSYADLSAATGTALTFGGATADGRGRIRATQSAPVLGKTLRVSVSAEIVLTGVNTIGFSGLAVNGVGIPQALVTAASKQLAGQLSLRSLPAGLTVRTLTANSSGVTAVVGGTEVVLHR